MSKGMNIPKEEKLWKLNKQNFLLVWRKSIENESAINTLFAEIDKLKKHKRTVERLL